MSEPINTPNQRAFVTTRWSIVLNAANEGAPKRQEALEQLCQDYWHRLYFYVLRLGINTHDAKDLIQGFFQKLLEKNYLKSVAPEKGRFRSFLIVALKRYIQNEFEKKKAIKRGGHLAHVSFDFDQADVLYSEISNDSQTPDEVYDRGFALTIIYKVFSRLEAYYEEKGKGLLFPFLQSTLPGQDRTLTYEAAADTFNIRMNTLKSEVHRFKDRFGNVLKETVAEIVPDATDIDDEIRYLLQTLKGT